MSALSIALDLAGAGLPVFPCSRNKGPAIPKEAGGRGFHDATKNPETIRQLFSRRNAVLVGVPTGEASGFDALDLDYRHGAGIWEAAYSHRIPETRVHETQSGGRHLLFAHAPGVRNSASGRALAPGVDVRGEGGYVIYPPSPGYRVISDAPIAHWPDWLLPLVLPPPPPPRPLGSSSPRLPLSSERITEFRERALNRVRNAPEGGKHFELRNVALLLGGIQDQAGFTDQQAWGWLRDALPSSVRDWRAAEKTATWGLVEGRRRPIEIETERAPDPRRKETARAAFRLLRRGLTESTVIATLRARNRQRPEPLPDREIEAIASWAITQPREAADAA